MASRPTTTLKSKLERNLLTYATAASAGGIGMLAPLQPAEAKVIYTSAHTRIGDNVTVPLDLDNDGKTDFNIQQSFSVTYTGYLIRGTLGVLPSHPSNQIVGQSTGALSYALALQAGVHIGVKKGFTVGKKVLAWGVFDYRTHGGSCFGNWVNVKHRYLGLRFAIGGKVHFGWARFNETCAENGDNNAVLTGYAYETVVKASIIAGDEGTGASLGHLALGNAAGRKLRAPVTVGK